MFLCILHIYSQNVHFTRTGTMVFVCLFVFPSIDPASGRVLASSSGDGVLGREGRSGGNTVNLTNNNIYNG